MAITEGNRRACGPCASGGGAATQESSTTDSVLLAKICYHLATDIHRLKFSLAQFLFSQTMCCWTFAANGGWGSKMRRGHLCQRGSAESIQEGTITMIRPEYLIQTLHLFSPSLPIGAFAFSRGLEAVIESRRPRRRVARVVV